METSFVVGVTLVIQRSFCVAGHFTNEHILDLKVFYKFFNIAISKATS